MLDMPREEHAVFVQFIRLESVAKADARQIAAAVTCGVTKGLDVEEEERKKKLITMDTVASYPGLHAGGGEKAWYTLFAHAH